MTRCERCGYFWREGWEDYPSCHYEGPDEWAPCEQDGDDYEEDDE